MPYIQRWVDPERFLKYKGVEVFHLYVDDEFNAGANIYSFTLDKKCGETECICGTEKCLSVFDVRELPTWTWTEEPSSLVVLDNCIRTAIRRAIDQKIIPPRRSIKDWRP